MFHVLGRKHNACLFFFSKKLFSFIHTGKKYSFLLFFLVDFNDYNMYIWVMNLLTMICKDIIILLYIYIYI